MKYRVYKTNFSGERAVEKNNDLFQSSLERYKFVAGLLKDGLDVLDIACGSGYGSSFIASLLTNGSVIGVDVSSEVIDCCNAQYQLDSLRFLCQSALVLNDNFINEFDLIISFETIEHFFETDIFLKNMSLYLRPGGIFILSTPNNFRKIDPPVNKYHKLEFDVLEMYNKLSNVLSDGYKIECFGQGMTNVRRGQIEKISLSRKILSSIIAVVYRIDLRTFNLLHKISSLIIYKKIGRLQKSYRVDFSVYKITADALLNNNFYNPETSIFVVHKK